MPHNNICIKPPSHHHVCVTDEGPADLQEANNVSPEVASWIKQCTKSLKIPKADRSWAAEVVNDFRDNLLKFLKSSTDQPFFQSAEFLTTGSYFEKVKVSRELGYFCHKRKKDKEMNMSQRRHGSQPSNLFNQIHSPDEFDMMLKLQAPVPLTVTMLDDGLFYRLNLNRPSRSHIRAFLLENELTVSSSMILNEIYRLVRKFLKTYKGL